MCLQSQDTAGNPKDVFLYNKAHLKANVQLPEPEDIAVPQADGKLTSSILYITFQTRLHPCMSISVHITEVTVHTE